MAEPSYAAQIVQTRSFDVSYSTSFGSGGAPTILAPASPLSFEGFDGDLGTLNSVTFNLSGQQRAELHFEVRNLGQLIQGVRGEAGGGAGLGLSSLNFGSGAFQVPLHANCGGIQVCAGSDLATSTLSYAKVLTGDDAFDYVDQAAIVALLRASITVDGLAETQSLCGFTICWQVADFQGHFLRLDAKGLVTLTYDYTPNTGGVPEPAAWALMIGGFGLAGGALRRRPVLLAGWAPPHGPA